MQEKMGNAQREAEHEGGRRGREKEFQMLCNLRCETVWFILEPETTSGASQSITTSASLVQVDVQHSHVAQSQV